MMSLINTNYNYLATMGIEEESPLVGVIVAVYYLGCAFGAILASFFADRRGRKPSILTCLATASAGNLLMFIAGLNGMPNARIVMLIGRVVMGLGVGGIDAVVPVFSSELSGDDSRGTALAQEFQANILGLNMAFIVNVLITRGLGKTNQWAWRAPIIIMQIFPILMIATTGLLPETPRWLVMHEKDDKAKRAIARVWGDSEVDSHITELREAHDKEQQDGTATYADMLLPGRPQFHPTVITVMGQVNQALTGYGAVSVYGPQMFGLLGFSVSTSEWLTMGNYLFYLGMMTFAWLLIDRLGRRWLLVRGAFWLAVSFALLALLGGLASNRGKLGIPLLATGVPGIVTLYVATAVFGIGWLVPPWLIPTEIYPSTARAQGAAISVVIWGLANFAVTLLTPIGFNNLQYGLLGIFCGTNAVAGIWTWLYCPETGNRSFEENQEFFKEAAELGDWGVNKVREGEFKRLPDQVEGDEVENGNKKDGDGEREPLLGNRDE
jgi:sugar porter (SP) family MFS transporter